MSWKRIRGHTAAKQLFLSAALRGRLGQSYLLVGPEGIGKHAFATELAKALLCERSPSALTACDICPGCRQVIAGTHPDVLRLYTPEGKLELPVEHMREFCSLLAFKPVRGGRKIGIVVDADDFNTESANSFLKLLEEPPVGVILLLIATSIDRQLPTILSRCQVVRFSPLSPEEVASVLADQEIADPALRERLVKLSSGSVSRALALTDEAVWKMRDELLTEITSEQPNFLTLASTWSQFLEGGKDSASQRHRASIVVGFLVDALRQALRISLGSATTGIDPSFERSLTAFARRLGPDRLLELIDRCLEADTRIERRVQLILVVEAVLDQFVRRRG